MVLVADSAKKPDPGKAMKTVNISPNVEIAMRSLDPDGVRQMHAWFDYLRRWDEDDVVRRNSVLLDSIPGVYVMRTTTDIRIFFRIDGDTITVLDIARTPAILTSAGVTGGVTVAGSAPAVINPDAKVK
jgi:hypothetical protein